MTAWRSTTTTFGACWPGSRARTDASSWKTRLPTHLERLQAKAKQKKWRIKYNHPGTKSDILFQRDYLHIHRKKSSAAGTPEFCKDASEMSCDELGCETAKLVQRDRLDKLEPSERYTPEVFIGRMGSGNTVMKSGEDRDRIAREHGLIAFEMEGVGVWDELPCIVVKGISDYAYSHKNKQWQNFAAATAAAVARGILEKYSLPDNLVRAAATAAAQTGGDQGECSPELKHTDIRVVAPALTRCYSTS